jgi:hypothetical protein
MFRSNFSKLFMLPLAGLAINHQQASAGTASYFIQQNYSINQTGVVCVAVYPSPCIYGVEAGARADAYASTGYTFPEIDAPSPVIVTGNIIIPPPFPPPPITSVNFAFQADNSAATSRSSSKSTGRSEGEIIGTVGSGSVSGTTLVYGSATANKPSPNQFSFASSSSSSFATYGVTGPGRISWTPIQTVITSGGTKNTSSSYSQINYTVFDKGTSSILADGHLVDINIDGDVGPEVDWNDQLLKILYPKSGNFVIDLTNDYIKDQGFLRLVAKDGKWVQIEKTGRFSSLELPSLGDPSSWSIPVDNLYSLGASECNDPNTPSGICMGYDFSSLGGPTAEAMLNLTSGGSAQAIERVPGPLPLLGLGAAYGWARKLRQRRKNII